MSQALSNSSESRGTVWAAVSIPSTVITLIIVIGRLLWRYKTHGRLQTSDFTAIAATVSLVAQLVLGCHGIFDDGLGHHSANIGATKTALAMMDFFEFQIFYKITVGVTKLSFLSLYKELFPIQWFQRLCKAISAFTAIATIAFTAGTIFQCTPVPYFWNRKIPGQCIDNAAFWYSHAAWNTATDIVILLLPIPVIRSLQMKMDKKIGALGVFMSGVFTVATSIIRMRSLDPASKVTDPTYVISVSDAFLWTHIESCAGIICSCLPVMWGIFRKVFPYIRSTKGSSEDIEIATLRPRERATRSVTTNSMDGLERSVLSEDGVAREADSVV